MEILSGIILLLKSLIELIIDLYFSTTEYY